MARSIASSRLGWDDLFPDVSKRTLLQYCSAIQTRASIDAFEQKVV
jgi:hypothetical protein